MTPTLPRFGVSGHAGAVQVDEYEAGAPTTDLMERYELGKGTVLGVLRRAGVPMRNQGLAAHDLGRVIVLYEAGVSLSKIADQFQCDAETIRKKLKGAGVQMRKPWDGPECGGYFRTPRSQQQVTHTARFSGL